MNSGKRSQNYETDREKKLKGLDENYDVFIGHSSKELLAEHAQNDRIDYIRTKIFSNDKSNEEPLLVNFQKTVEDATRLSNTFLNQFQSSKNPTVQDPLSMSMENTKVNASTSNNPTLIADLSVPVVKVEDCQCNMEFQMAVLAELKQLNERLNNIEDFLIDKKVKFTDNKIDFEKKYNISIPFQTLDEFFWFEAQMKVNQFLRDDVCTELCSCMDKDYSITRSFVKMLKMFLSKEVALQFTAFRKSADKNKEQFKDTELRKCMDVVVKTRRQEVQLTTTEKELISSHSDVFGNVKKWNINKKPS